MTIARARAEVAAEEISAPGARSARVLLPCTRAGGRGPTWEYASVRELPALGGLVGAETHAHLVAALVALLHRYAQQCELELDVFVNEPGSAEREARLDFVLDGDSSFATVRAAARAGLSTPSCRRERSSVALTFASFVTKTVAPSTRADEHELHFVVHEAEERSALLVAYDGSLFERATVDRLLESFLVLLEASLGDARRTLAALPLLSGAESAAILRASEGPAARASEHELAHRCFERLAAEQSHALAVCCGDRQLSYGELDLRAARLAHYLAAAGVRAESAVAVCLTPSVDVLVALLAILKAGGMYVPLDPSHPRALLAQILEESRPALVLTCRAAQGALPPDVHCFCFEDDWSVVEQLPALSPVASVRPDQACYVLYTSGTTGRPKGVVASQQNLAHYLGVARDRYGFRSSDRFCSLARYTFSISFFELLSPLTCGGSLVLLTRDEVLDPARLAAQLQQATVIHAGPSLLASLSRHLRKVAGVKGFERVRHVSTGGDLVPPALLEELKSVFAKAELFVIYGCTEISCMGCTAPVSRAHESTRTLVGAPFEGMALRVLDAHGGLVPFGVVGEVYFAGKGLARRYLSRPELTSEKFVAIDGQRFYRTGDLGRLWPDGQLELLGRSDFQVQLRGIRVELGGIEHTLRELGLAEQCAVVAAHQEENDVRLVAFLVGPSAHDATAMRALLAQRLPDYMLPQAFVVLEALPLTHNGKLDRRALQQLAAAPAPRSAHAESASATLLGATERVVAEAFAKVLKLSGLGRDADFFLLGGHSLLAVLVAEELADRLGRRVSPALLFEHTRVSALARALESADDAPAAPILLGKDGKKPALFMLLGVQLYRELALELEDKLAVYGVYAASELALLDLPTRAPSVAELARDYVSLIRAQQPHGPYRLGGMSFGGVVAYEVAQQLEQQGQEVELLLLLDALLPQTRLERARRLLTMPTHELLTLVGRRTRARIEGRKRTPSTLGRLHDEGSLQALEERRQEAYRAAATKYASTAQPYAGEVTLLVAGERLARDALLDPACGFAGLVENLSVHMLPADHLALLERPAVQQVAACALAAARQPGRRAATVPLQAAALTGV